MAAHLNHLPAIPTDQELRRMGLRLFVRASGAPGHTANKRRQPFNSVDQTLVDQEVR
jgi:hypothetical protein